MQEIDNLNNSASEGLSRILLKYGLFTENKNVVILSRLEKAQLKDFQSVRCVYSFLEDIVGFVFGAKTNEKDLLEAEAKEELVRLTSLIENLMEIVNVIR